MPSFHSKSDQFDPPAGYVPCNPSVINKDGQPLILVRTVNYTINAEGGYDIRDGDGACSDRNPIHTRNFLVYPQYSVELRELLPTDDRQPTVSVWCAGSRTAGCSSGRRSVDDIDGAGVNQRVGASRCWRRLSASG